MNRKIIALCIAAIALGLFFTTPLLILTPANAADGTVGEITANVNFIVSGMPVTVRAYDLTAGADYLINHTNDDTGFPFVAPSDGDYQITIPNIVKPSGASVVNFYLRYQSAGTLIATASTTVFNLQDFLVTSLIVLVGVFVLVIVIVRRISGK